MQLLKNLKRLLTAIQTLAEAVEGLAITLGVLDVHLRLQAGLRIPIRMDDGDLSVKEWAQKKFAKAEARDAGQVDPVATPADANGNNAA